VAIARAFAVRPKVLFADEPTGNLDTETGKKVIDLLFNINTNEQATLVLVTHDTSLSSLCDSKITIASGKIKT
jgi:putative ABC transport system ATP-binding protein